MVESSLEATKRLLSESLAECDDEECNFRVRTALQLLDAMQAELEETRSDLAVFERALADNPDLQEALGEAGIEDV